MRLGIRSLSRGEAGGVYADGTEYILQGSMFRVALHFSGEGEQDQEPDA